MTDIRTEKTTHEFTITRVLDAPAELVYRAWTEPAQLTAWLGPHNFTTPLDTIAVDARVGGRWRATMIAPDGEEFPTGGIYRELVPYQRIVFSWGNADGDTIENAVLTCSVTLSEADGRTTMTFHQIGPATIQDTNDMFEGWGESFSRLVVHVGSSSS